MVKIGSPGLRLPLDAKDGRISLIEKPSTPQKADSIRPVPLPRFFEEAAQGSYEATRIRGRDGLFVDKDHAAVLSLLYRPSLEQRRNRPAIVSDES
jgi:hypothetical protein